MQMPGIGHYELNHHQVIRQNQAKRTAMVTESKPKNGDLDNGCEAS
jgi:hypothetical protein